MSAPLVVNVVGGAVWLRQAAVRDGLALYAPEKCGACPEFVMVTYAELEARGVVGSADALPVPVGPQMPPFPPAPETFEEKLRADVARLQGLLAEAVADKHRALRERDLMRERVSEPFGCALCGEVERSHGRRYIGGAGMHTWERPADEQVKARMLARRVGRRPMPPAPELEQVENDLTGARLSLYEEELETARLRLALASAQRGRSRLRARVAELEARPSPADVLRQAADDLTAACPDHSDADEAWMDCPCEFADELRRKADLIGSGEGGCACPSAGRLHQVGCPQDGVPVAGPSFAERASRETDPGRRVAWRMLAEPEGEFYPAVHHSYLKGRDLDMPETGGPQ